MVDLSTRYLGFELAHPVVPSASPLTGDLDSLHALVEAGAPAVVLPSLFEEQIEHDAMAVYHGYAADGFSEATTGLFPELDDYNAGPADYLGLVHGAKRELSIPVIASLNGSTPGGWTLYAKILEDAGVDALELNTYMIPAEADKSSSWVEATYLNLVEQVRSKVEIPLAVKLSPYFSSMAAMARRITDAGADALVLFNRFYQPDIDLETLDVDPHLILSTPSELRLPLLWIAVLRGQIDCDLAATSGIHTSEEVIKLVLAGADVTMVASALLLNGPDHLRTLVGGLQSWLTTRQYRSLSQAKGSLSRANAPDPAAFERANYMRTLVSFTSDWRDHR